MPHEFFDSSEVNASEDETGCECVTKVVKAAWWNAGPLNCSLEGMFYITEA